MFVNIQIRKIKIHTWNNNFNFSKKKKLNETNLMYKKIIYGEKIYYSIIEKFQTQMIKHFVIFIEHFLIRNKYTNLVSKQSLSILYKKHFLDSLSLFSFFNSIWLNYNKRNCLDIGTGGGFPGFILSIIFPQIYFSLIDSIGKKIIFHSKLFSFLELKNSNALRIRAEFLGELKKYNIFYNLILARAVSDIPIIIELSTLLLRELGNLVMMKKIYNISNEIKNSLLIMCNNKLKVKTILVTSTRDEGKIIIVIKKK